MSTSTRVRFNPRLFAMPAAQLGSVMHRTMSSSCATSALLQPSARRLLPVRSSFCTHTPICLAFPHGRDSSAVQPPPVQTQRILSLVLQHGTTRCDVGPTRSFFVRTQENGGMVRSCVTHLVATHVQPCVRRPLAGTAIRAKHQVRFPGLARSLHIP